MMARRIAGTFMVRAGSAAASLIFAAVIVQLYSLSRFGEFAFALASVRLVGVIAQFSLDSLLLRMLLRLKARRTPHLNERLIRECSGFAALISAAFTLGLVAVALVGLRVSESNGFWVSLLCLVPLILGQNAANMQSAWLRLERRDYQSQLVVVGIPIIVPLLLCAPFMLGDVRPALLPELAMITGMLLSVLVGWRLTGIAPLTGFGLAARNFRITRLRVLRYSSAVHAANVMNFITDWYGGFLLAVTQSFEVVGILRIFQQFGKAVHLVSHSVELPFSTEIANAHINRDWHGIRRLLLQSQLILGGASIVFCAAVYFTADIIFAIYALDGEGVRLAFFVFIALTASRLFAGASSSALNIMDTTPQLIRASQISVISGVTMLSLLVPFFGLTGAALGLGLQVALHAAINYAFARSVLIGRP